MKLKATLFLMIFGFTNAYANQTYKDCRAYLKNDTLVVSNNKIQRKWLWNSGNIIPIFLTDKWNSNTLAFTDNANSFNIKGYPFIGNESLNFTVVTDDLHFHPYLAVTIISNYKSFSAKHVFRIHPEIAAISTDLYLKYKTLDFETKIDKIRTTGLKNSFEGKESARSFADHYSLHSRHWKLKFVEFKDITDANNNLVSEMEVIPYRPQEKYTGNLLMAIDLVSKSKFYVLKEAPNTYSQVRYPGYDFYASRDMIDVAHSGFPDTLGHEGWVKGYTITCGVPSSEIDLQTSLKYYLKNSIVYKPEVNEMVMMNTWGDRGQDGKISEKFILNELEGAKRLGITHFQIDDGWQQGLSQNSATKGSTLWDAWTAKDWEPNNSRFPNGWSKIIKSANEKNIQLGLWFHPTNDNEYKTWESDANILLDIYKKYGIKYFKIDGVEIVTKTAEINFAKFLDKVKAESNSEVFFNLDCTANIRGGYFMFRNAGNLFLENRYTDSGRYYPYQTLRNLWMLSKYFPAQLLQIEFLNKWRNANKYPSNDPFAPANYNFDYVFGTTLMAQPLAWLESSNLPEEAYRIAPLVNKYTSVMADIHKGVIKPIGDEPSGVSFTGFQSVQKNKGYFIIYRESTDDDTVDLKTFLPKNAKISIEEVYKANPNSNVQYSNDGSIKVKLQSINSFILVKYAIKD
ncbi:alpha-galactosidase [Daejeonella sp.]|uniref:alpha-galactosidase n=1 Tax=Daejeonella sp. TaxID=2805397 RepID=UPI0030BDF12E